MRGFVLGILVTLVAIAVGVFAVSYFGLYPIGADNPPSSLERTLASRALDEYADRHKPAGGNPAPITPANLMEGAKEYEEHCAFCHGGAKAKISPMQNKFNPPAPQLVNRVPHDPDNWLFWVTKHGVRMTGMPTWDGVMSDEDIWKIIAFLKNSNKLPPEAAAAWQKLASEPTEIDEHTPEQHKHGDADHGKG
jgi:mono/diheme cytochrome c family protein